MRRLLFAVILLSFATDKAPSRPFTVDDLLAISSLSPKDIGHFMSKRGYKSLTSNTDDNLITTRFFEANKGFFSDSLVRRSVEVYKKNSTRYFILNTSSANEYAEGKKRLVDAGFLCAAKKSPGRDTTVLFQKNNITVETMTSSDDGDSVYTFLLKKKELPDANSIRHAEDLLTFDSHESLVSFFGQANVKKDLYFFSEKELKKCSVIFMNTNRQAVFVWDDGASLCNLSSVLISNIIPTVGAKEFGGFMSNNQWSLTNGVYCGMSLKELLRLNENDFEFYGNQSEFAFIVKPKVTGKLDFKKFAVTLSCMNCNNDKLFNVSEVKAQDATDENLPMYVYTIVLFPPQH